jgi:transcriptional regulator with XRE-family HTH domain
MQQTKAFGARLRGARVARGWTQADASHYTRISSADISRIETGRLIPTKNQLDRLTAALGVSVNGHADFFPASA